MNYEDFLEHYSPELQLIDALDLLRKGQVVEAAEILEKLGVGPTNGKNSEEQHH